MQLYVLSRCVYYNLYVLVRTKSIFIIGWSLEVPNFSVSNDVKDGWNSDESDVSPPEKRNSGC